MNDIELQKWVNYFKSKFQPSEVAPDHLAKELGDRVFDLIDVRLMAGVGWMRNKLGKSFTVNVPGRFNWRGIRTTGYDKYNPGSMHSLTDKRLCGAMDFDVKSMTAQEVRDWLKINKPPFINRCEDNVNWVHVDIKETGKEGVYFFKP